MKSSRSNCNLRYASSLAAPDLLSPSPITRRLPRFGRQPSQTPTRIPLGESCGSEPHIQTTHSKTPPQHSFAEIENVCQAGETFPPIRHWTYTKIMICRVALLIAVCLPLASVGCGNSTDPTVLPPADDKSIYEAEEARIDAEAAQTGGQGV
ncbi:hypothetical protein [Stieleria tagensis]|uniref:hypothetical protein n=1 Tax=Stieleria tagensis TaxID=2956795 RepID=UPI00209ABD20|nr:hypothetical protein [Stieleria tagensis]